MVIDLRRLNEPVSALGMSLFRVLFGAVAALGALRFFYYDWVDKLYISTSMQFHYWGVGWLDPLPGSWMYAPFVVMALAALAVMVGWRTRLALVVYFASFTYVELLDKTTYLNHYYFVSMMALLLAVTPCNARLSLDARAGRARGASAPRWAHWLLRGQVGVVYFFAGVAKLESDWLLRGEPLGAWLRARSDFPVIGWLFELGWVPLVMSWSGMLFDLTVVFFLMNRRSRPFAYVAVVGFHVITGTLFPIGVFPWLMIAGATLFFEPDWPERMCGHLEARAETPAVQRLSLWGAGLLAAWFVVQVSLPMRYLAYPGEVCWTEQGFRFSWRVMLIEKTGSVEYVVQSADGEKRWEVMPGEDLTPLQAKMMSTQPDMILEYAHVLRDRYNAKGYGPVRVYVDSWVVWNGRPAARLIDPSVDLASEEDTLAPKSWILPAPD